MRRRRFVSAVASITSLSLAGCSEVIGSKNKVENISFSIIESERKMRTPVVVPANEANTIIVNGVINTSNGCMTAKFNDFTHHRDKNLLQITVGEKRDDETSNKTMCTQALTPISYKIQIQFTKHIPEKLTIRHKGGEPEKFTIPVPKKDKETKE